MHPTIETHVVTLIPPSEQRITWLAICSHRDMNRSYRNRVEALEAATGHINELALRNSLETSRYEFDDGE